ncbi:DEAD/DEAH box helicase [bacterium]|nr:DEAD/DEAH box helicase [bacterium]
MSGCITFQSDMTVSLEAQTESFPEARDFLLTFAELVKCPEYIHTYRITPLSLWNAAALGMLPDDLLQRAAPFLRFPIPAAVESRIREVMSLWGLVRFERTEEGAILISVANEALLHHLLQVDVLRAALLEEPYRKDPQSDVWTAEIEALERGPIKVALMEIGIPVLDLAGYADGAPLSVSLRDTVQLRPYQRDALDGYYRNNSPLGGSGVVVLPCGAGKTVVAMGIIAELGMQTLIVVTNTTALKQWRRELLEKTSLTEDDIGEYSAARKEIRPLTIATYQILTSRKSKREPFRHFALFEAQNWGLIVYDEVHLLPAPVFQVTAALQARRRLGLTATLVREDGKEGHVFALIGPKRYESPWKLLETQGWLAKAHCYQVRVPAPFELLHDIKQAKKRFRFRMASTNPLKLQAVEELLRQHEESPVLIIGMYLDQLEELATYFDIPLLQGSTKQQEREEKYQAFQEGRIRRLIVSKIGNASVDLPDASVAIQVSGMFGSRQEEAQRLGRILRPKPGENQAHFYSVITAGTTEEEYGLRRQLFLAEQGYGYGCIDFKLDYSSAESHG